MQFFISVQNAFSGHESVHSITLHSNLVQPIQISLCAIKVTIYTFKRIPSSSRYLPPLKSYWFFVSGTRIMKHSVVRTYVDDMCTFVNNLHSPQPALLRQPRYHDDVRRLLPGGTRLGRGGQPAAAPALGAHGRWPPPSPELAGVTPGTATTLAVPAGSNRPGRWCSCWERKNS